MSKRDGENSNSPQVYGTGKVRPLPGDKEDFSDKTEAMSASELQAFREGQLKGDPLKGGATVRELNVADLVAELASAKAEIARCAGVKPAKSRSLCRTKTHFDADASTNRSLSKTSPCCGVRSTRGCFTLASTTSTSATSTSFSASTSCSTGRCNTTTASAWRSASTCGLCTTASAWRPASICGRCTTPSAWRPASTWRSASTWRPASTCGRCTTGKLEPLVRQPVAPKSAPQSDDRKLLWAVIILGLIVIACGIGLVLFILGPKG